MYSLDANSFYKNNAIHRKIKDISIAWMLSHCKNNAIHCKINDICIAWRLTHGKNNAIHCESRIYVLPGC